MSIQPIRSGDTVVAFQARVFRAGKVFTRYAAVKAHGGKRSAFARAQEFEQELERMAGPQVPARRSGDHASLPNKNSTTGIAGIRAYYLQREGCKRTLQFSTFWTEQHGKRKIARRLQRSAAEHGLLAALAEVLAAREAGTGIEMPSARSAWAKIKPKLDRLA